MNKEQSTDVDARKEGKQSSIRSKTNATYLWMKCVASVRKQMRYLNKINKAFN